MMSWASQGIWLLTIASIELCVLTGIVWIATTVGTRWSSANKQLLWAVTLLKPVTVLFAFILGIQLLPATDLTEQSILGDLGVAAGNLGHGAGSSGGLNSMIWLLPALFVVWAVGLFATLFGLLGGIVASWGLIRRAQDSGLKLNPSFLRGLGIRPPADVDIIVTDWATSPGSYGLWFSTVLVPSDWLPLQENGTLAPDDAVALRHVLQHELGHVRRHDGLRQFLMKLLASPFWFHPLAHFVLHRWLDVVEMEVDSRVLHDSRNDPTQYAKTLISAVKRSVPQRASAGTWFLGHSRRAAVRGLRRRLMRVLTPPQRMPWISKVTSTACAIAVLTSFPITVATVRTPDPQQEIESNEALSLMLSHPYNSKEFNRDLATLDPEQQEQVRRFFAIVQQNFTIVTSGGRVFILDLNADFLATYWPSHSLPGHDEEDMIIAGSGETLTITESDSHRDTVASEKNSPRNNP